MKQDETTAANPLERVVMRRQKTELWHNIVGATIPDWIQGRGTGAPGSVLTIIDDAGSVFNVRPGDVLEKDDHYGFKIRGNAFQVGA